MKKIIKSFFLFSFFFLFLSTTSAKEATMYFFYGQGCPHCAEEENLLVTLENKYKDLTIVRYEVWYNPDNQQIMQDMAEKRGIEIKGVPLTIVGDEYISGYISSYDSSIENMVISATKDDISNITDNENKKENGDSIKDNKQTIYDLPLIGKVDIKKVSIPLIAAVIGLVDGFNPCAMWVLLFLISMLIGMHNRKRMWSLGIAFLVSSALVYMLIMLSWLQIVININTSIVLRNIIAIIALIGAIININSYIKTRKTNGCVVVNDNKRKKTIDKIKTFTHEKSFFFALLGVIGLAISVNFIELACSAGLPLLFTQILALNDITGIWSLLYTLIYIFFFLIDDLIIFIIAMITLKISGISTKYTKYSHLIGGILMLIIGLLLIFKPEWIMFNF